MTNKEAIKKLKNEIIGMEAAILSGEKCVVTDKQVKIIKIG